MAPNEVSTESQASLVEAPNFASPIQPQEADQADERLILVWGRIWGENSDVKAGFFVRYNVSSDEFEHLSTNFHPRLDQLTPYDPDQSASNFLRTLLETEDTSESTSDSDQQVVRASLQQAFREPDLFEKLVDALESKRRDSFKEWGRNLLRNIYKSGEVHFQIKGQIMSKSLYSGPEPSSENRDRSADDNQENPPTDDRQTVPVDFVTSPVNGKRPEKLSKGNMVHARVTGDVVEKLPNFIVDDEREQATLPLPCSLENLERSEEIVTMEVTVDDGIKGIGEISTDSRIKISNPDEEQDDESLFSEVALGLLLLAAILLFLMQF